MTKRFLELSAAFAFLSAMALAGYSAGGHPHEHCETIASVIKIGGLCK